MKNFLLACSAAMILASCSTIGTDSTGTVTAGSLGSGLIKAAANQKCRVELNKRAEWRAVSLAVSAEQQATWENNICGCVSDEAPNHISVTDLAQASVSAEKRNTVVASAVTETVSACMAKFVSN